MAIDEATAAAKPGSRAVELQIHGKSRIFDIDDPDLPKWIDDEAFGSDDYPYKKKLDSDEYQETLTRLQIELVKVQFWMQATGKRVMAVSRDATPPARAARSMRRWPI